MSRKCQREGCDKALPPAAATQRKFCSTRCQVADWRARNKPGQKREQGDDRRPPPAACPGKDQADG